MADDDRYGTAPLDAPVTRGDFERALRHLNMSDLELRDAVLQLAARVVTLTDELTRRVDGVEPAPAPPNTPAAPPEVTLEDAVLMQVEDNLVKVRANDLRAGSRVSLDIGNVDKYTVESVGPDCAALLPICGARCCTLTFALSTADLDEGVVRWDYGQPYLIRQRASDGYCVHNDPERRFCTVHEHRPRVCRVYDCREDARIWKDYAQRIPAELPLPQGEDKTFTVDLVARLRARTEAIDTEQKAITETFAERAPRRGD